MLNDEDRHRVDRVNFFILGNVHISTMKGWHGNLPLKARQLLALLLTVGRSGLSTERAAQFLWGGDQPSSAAQMVRSHVMRIRSALGNGKSRIEHSRSCGYYLEALDSEVDAQVFERGLQEGRRQLDRGRTNEALRHLENAIELWQGSTALSDVSTIVELEAEAARLAELKLQAQEAFIEAHLLQGGANKVVPQLLSLSIQYPLRESFLIQLMLSLTATGRHIEAATVYMRARERFIEQAGIEPSPEAARIHAGILRRENWHDLLPHACTSAGPAQHLHMLLSRAS